MKLEEIIEEPYKINLTEVLNTVVNTQWTTTNTGDRYGVFDYGDSQFQIRLNKLPIEDFNIIHISFYIWNTEEQRWTIGATLTNKQAAAIVGAIFNAIKTEIPNHIFDALVFGAIDQTDKRMRIYNFLMNRYIKHLGNFIDNLPGPNGSLWSIVCTKAVSRNFTNTEIMDMAYPYLNKEV